MHDVAFVAGDIGMVVLDEVHMISEAFRGYTLELIVSKLLCANSKHMCDVQIVAMSATLPNADEVLN